MKTSNRKSSPRRRLRGVVVIQPHEENLIQLLDEGKIDEFRRRLSADREQRRKQMFARVMAGR